MNEEVQKIIDKYDLGSQIVSFQIYCDRFFDYSCTAYIDGEYKLVTFSICGEDIVMPKTTTVDELVNTEGVSTININYYDFGTNGINLW